ncbi:MAG: luciferase family protein [Candidatus Sulfotelmatobacter sp.]
MTYLKSLEDELSAWPHISVHSHRFGGREFRFGSAELGHMHNGGILDIPFPRKLRDALLGAGLAEEHRWVPNSGWITFHVRSEDDFKHAVWLLRLSYLRYALKTASNPRELLNRQCEKLHLNAHFTSLLEPFIPAHARILAQSGQVAI